jgi:hypothetical protein
MQMITTTANSDAAAPKAGRKIAIPASERPVWTRDDLRRRYNISAPTLWRWMKTGKIPTPDVHVAGKPHGWNQRTILNAETAKA